MYNGDRNESWLTYPNDPKSPRRLPTDSEIGKDFLFRAQLLFLMETKWFKPIPLKVTTEWIGLKKVDVVHTRIDIPHTWLRSVGKYPSLPKIVSIPSDGYQLWFFLDRQTHLPLKIKECELEQECTEREGALYTLSDYSEFDGIQMPRKVKYWPTTGYIPHAYQVNVDYDPGVFERPPTVEAGPYAWQRKVRPQP
jgi:hypothetical protein